MSNCTKCKKAYSLQLEPCFRAGLMVCYDCARTYDDRDQGEKMRWALEDLARQPPEIMEFFKYLHLPPALAKVSKGFCELAENVTDTIAPGPERAVALRKLLEAKDAAVRAKLVPGG